MRKDEAEAFKHNLSDLHFYKQEINELSSRVDDIWHELSYPTISYGDVRLENRDGNLYTSERFERLTREISELEKLIFLYQEIVRVTEDKLEWFNDDIRGMLVDIYVEKRRPYDVALKYCYSDEKAMYRVIRKALR